MTTHTPGPWEIGNREGEHLPILDSAGNYLALADFENVANNADKVDANARLIAAAPDLLKAVQFIADSIDCGNYAANSASIEGYVRAAIAKATG